MSFLSGSSWQQPGIISGTSGFGQPSSGHQQQQQHQQQHKPNNTLCDTSIPVVLASSHLSPSSPASDLHIDRHCQGQMALGGQGAAKGTQAMSKTTLFEDDVKLMPHKPDGTSPETLNFKMPLVKMEDKSSRGGRLRADGQRVRGAGSSLGSAGQSPSSPLSSHSPPSYSLPSPSISPGKSVPNSTPDFKLPSDQDFGQRKGLGGGAISPSRSSPGHREREIKSVEFPSTGGQESLHTGNQILKPSSGNESVIKPIEAGQTGGLLSGVGWNEILQSGKRKENLSHNEIRQTHLYASASRCAKGMVTTHDQSQDLSQVEDERPGLFDVLKTETKTSQSNELPQRATVRRAMSDCSHLSVPMVMAETYPTSMGGSPVIPNMPNSKLMGTDCPPKQRFPHMAVRRSLTVTDGSAAAAAMATRMSSPLMTSLVLPSSPPPKKHHGSCETNFLLAVPPPAATFTNSTADDKLNKKGKSVFMCTNACVGLDVIIKHQVITYAS